MDTAETRPEEVAGTQAANSADQDRIAKEKAAKKKKDFDEWMASDERRVQAAREERMVQEALKLSVDQLAMEKRKERREKDRAEREKNKAEREKAEKGRKQSGAKRGPDPADEDDSANKKAKIERVLKTTTCENELDCIENDSCKVFRDAMDLARYVYDPATKNSAPPGPVVVGSYTDLDVIFQALASVTEAINKTRLSAKQPRTYSLFHRALSQNTTSSAIQSPSPAAALLCQLCGTTTLRTPTTLSSSFFKRKPYAVVKTETSSGCTTTTATRPRRRTSSKGMRRML